MLGRPFESRMDEIDIELRNLGEEMVALRNALAALERISIDALSKWEAIVARRQTLMGDFAMPRHAYILGVCPAADMRRAQ
jgi:hypothetical protein